MKEFILITTLLFIALSGNAQVDAEQEKKVVKAEFLVNEDYIKWESLVFDFGEIPQDEPAKAQFKLSNVGTSPFVLTKVNGSCGCTDIEYPEGPILPETTDILEATYDAKELGKFVKSITVFTNKEARPYILMLRGVVIEKSKSQ